MVLDLIAEIVFSLLDFVRMVLIVAIPVFLVVLPSQKLHAFLKKRFKLSWILASFATTCLVLLPVVFVLYLAPFFAGYMSSNLVGQPAPDFMQLTALDYAMAVLATIVKNLLSVLLFAILLMPLLFLASFAEEKIEERFKLPKLANTFIAVFLTTVFSWIVVLFIFPWIVNAVLWKLYWSAI